MPAILADAAAESAWLDPAVAKTQALDLLRPWPAAEMVVRPASLQVNDVRTDGPDLLQG